MHNAAKEAGRAPAGCDIALGEGGRGGMEGPAGGGRLPHPRLDRLVTQHADVRPAALLSSGGGGGGGGGGALGPRHEASARLHVQHHDAQRRAAARLAEDDRGAAVEQRVCLGGGDGEQAVREDLGAPHDADGGELGQLRVDALLDEPAVVSVRTCAQTA